jgi:hypothetical protein
MTMAFVVDTILSLSHSVFPHAARADSGSGK